MAELSDLLWDDLVEGCVAVMVSIIILIIIQAVNLSLSFAGKPFRQAAAERFGVNIGGHHCESPLHLNPKKVEHDKSDQQRFGSMAIANILCRGDPRRTNCQHSESRMLMHSQETWSRTIIVKAL
jgi:hypothetical protein